ncbi:hypothetical protein AJ79_00979 [Helicocarpus griseus UAMH5409]|uniref:Extracellular membrane protein CFEM domain-containing protein n=1 Tax=Helicocarpus griseus UAMH5409 TaxID=1447875 RepID=A0A2B7Y9M2_9EURO|nr:hypothetical protein AJ79_00979 [Helicocarpus griseus UAMH5409]
MHKKHWTRYVLFACKAPVILAVSLDQIQPIVSFTPSCTRVYTSQISNCTASDFTNRGSCSPECIESLEAVSVALNNECVGTRASSGSLIGLFFQGIGVQTLCPNAGGERDAAPTDTLDIASITESKNSQPTRTATEREGPSLLSTDNPDATNTTSASGSDSVVAPSAPSATTSATQTTSEPSTTVGGPTNDPFGGFGNALDIIAPNAGLPTFRTRRSQNMLTGIAAAVVLFGMRL